MRSVMSPSKNQRIITNEQCTVRKSFLSELSSGSNTFTLRLQSALDPALERYRWCKRRSFFLSSSFSLANSLIELENNRDNESPLGKAVGREAFTFKDLITRLTAERRMWEERKRERECKKKIKVEQSHFLPKRILIIAMRLVGYYLIVLNAWGWRRDWVRLKRKCINNARKRWSETIFF